jgi:hypothetical protein
MERYYIMQEILETIMLICFGFSWPINVYKSIKSKTAAGMCKPFLILIILGYAAGIAAKFVSGNVNYVLAVYFINIAMVIINLGVYYRNKKLDMLKDAETTGTKPNSDKCE